MENQSAACRIRFYWFLSFWQPLVSLVCVCVCVSTTRERPMLAIHLPSPWPSSSPLPVCSPLALTAVFFFFKLDTQFMFVSLLLLLLTSQRLLLSSFSLMKYWGREVRQKKKRKVLNVLTRKSTHRGGQERKGERKWSSKLPSESEVKCSCITSSFWKKECASGGERVSASLDILNMLHLAPLCSEEK